MFDWDFLPDHTRITMFERPMLDFFRKWSSFDTFEECTLH